MHSDGRKSSAILLVEGEMEGRVVRADEGREEIETPRYDTAAEEADVEDSDKD